MRKTKSNQKTEDLFPHSNFGYRVEHKDGNDNKICWFCHHTHVAKYFEKYKIDASTCKIDVHPDYPPLEEKQEKVKKPRTTKKDKVFADLDTYVKITDVEEKPKRTRKKTAEAAPAAPRSGRKTPAKTPKQSAADPAAKPRTASPRSKKK
jgi:hypothetical protein